MSKENDNFKAIRTTRGLSQADFAVALGISEAMVRKIEQNHNNVSLNVARKIREVYGVSLDFIYGFTDDTHDEASTMLLYLTKLFDYKESCHSVSVKKCVADFLNSYAQAKGMFEAGTIPAAAYDPWIDHLKHDLNDAMRNDVESAVELYLTPKAEFDEFMEFKNRNLADSVKKTLADMNIKFSSIAAEEKNISVIIARSLSGDSLRSYIKEQKEVDPDAFAPDTPVPRIVAPSGGGHSAPPTESTPSKRGLFGRGGV